MKKVNKNSSEIRRDYIQEKYVIIAPRRKKRFLSSAGADGGFSPCAFCPDSLKKEHLIFSWPKKGSWKIAVIPNLYPAVSIGNPKAYGVQEVVVETPDPESQLEDLPIGVIAEVLRTYALRTKAISKNKKIQYILIFKNSGGRAGATIHHAHSQIFAADFVPPHLINKSLRANEYKVRTGRCVYCDTINRERKSPRLVFEDKHIVALTPYASMHNYEIWILPKKHLDNITELNNAERQSWAALLKKLLHKINLLGLPYNFYFHQVISDDGQHLYMKITPRGSIWAGVEIGSGVIINPVTPEEAAKYYRAS